MKAVSAAFALGLMAGAAVSAAHAQSSPWSLHAGVAHVRFSPTVDLSVAGQPVPDAGVRLDANRTAAVEIAYDLDTRWSLRMALGVPPTTTLRTAGSLSALVPPLTGKLGEVKYAPVVPSVTYRLLTEGPVRPYVGLGLNYMKVLATPDGDLAHMDVEDAWGTVLQAGFDVPLNPRWSIFLDARRMRIKTTATGTLTALGGLPVRGEVNLRPTVIFAGLGYRF
ncbi:outer membrane beta-barrel protein [Aquincola tertiaricarbonis]|uniref:Outer membrane beta-barrel protein n=1 Tax=Aquincola tertiaricarbonis TaxID=391953 RepID=A0ABY4SDL3_AQUTE|nr:OmpW family outer membrane protein [Aquincola tertiaricarbonis]URI11089.1 outer membrane beta-barrel protein [Aquincola tertiaricarbonis]